MTDKSKNVDDAISDIVYTHDGPVTTFVAISRALRLAKEGTYTTDTLANALFEILSTEDRTILHSTEY